MSTFEQYLQTKGPELWNVVVELELADAAIWGWSPSRLAGVEFEAVAQPDTDYWDLCIRRGSGRCDNAAWAGLDAGHVTPNGAVARTDDGEALAVKLNLSAACYRGETYVPTGRNALTLGRLHVEYAARTGDIEGMRGALEQWGRDELDSAYAQAAWTAAKRGDIRFLRTLIEAVGPEASASNRIMRILLQPEPEQEAQDVVAVLMAAGVKPPAGTEAKAGQWLADRLADRLARVAGRGKERN